MARCSDKKQSNFLFVRFSSEWKTKAQSGCLDKLICAGNAWQGNYVITCPNKPADPFLSFVSSNPTMGLITRRGWQSGESERWKMDRVYTASEVAGSWNDENCRIILITFLVLCRLIQTTLINTFFSQNWEKSARGLRLFLKIIKIIILTVDF